MWTAIDKKYPVFVMKGTVGLVSVVSMALDWDVKIMSMLPWISMTTGTEFWKLIGPIM